VTSLPSTGTGTVVNDRDEGISPQTWIVMLAIVFLAAAIGNAVWSRKRSRTHMRQEVLAQESKVEHLDNGMVRMRFR
jgi:hypothetical protein